MSNTDDMKDDMKSNMKDKTTDETITAVTKKKRRNGLDMMWNGDTEPGDNSRYVRHALVAWKLPPIDISDPEQVEQRITDYFDYCVQNDLKPQMVAMANWLGVSRETLNLWKKGEYRSETHFDIIKKAVDVLEQIWADYMQNGKINPASGIFLGKNFFGYKDQQDVVVTPNNPLDNLNADEARKKYIEALPDPDE